VKPGGFQHRLNEARQLLLGQDFAQALSRYAKLTRAFPGQAVVWFEYGTTAARLGQLEAASRAWDRAMALEPRNAELIVQIGHQYQGLRQSEQARACFARAAAADAKAVNPRISLAVLLEQQHRLDQARAAVAECLAIDPRDDQGRYLSAVLDRRENQLEAAEGRLRQLIQSDPRHPYVRYACRYELAQILDRTGRFDEAMKLLIEAKQIVRALTDTEVLLKNYDWTAERARQFSLSQPRNILRAWAKSFPAEKREAVPSLTFLGGHPRSGTTLLEQVLGAHPGVAALDEPLAFAEVLQPALCQTPDHSSARLNVLRRLYTRALMGEIGGAETGKLLLDKNPSFTAQLPLWLRVFPELRVLVALRDPRDVALSCYFQNLLLNATNANFLSLERLAKHYADLMDVWLAVREWEGFAWLETRYEAIVADLEKEGRRVTGFLGLEWHEEQNRFYEKSRQKQLYSPTYQDVTRPVYASSVGRWRAYEKHLAPILPALEPYCRILGYE
jgi:tetratricopeptide (TPR) repeat protein